MSKDWSVYTFNPTDYYSYVHGPVAYAIEYNTYEDSENILLDVFVPGYTKENITSKIENKRLIVTLKDSIRKNEKRNPSFSNNPARLSQISLELRNEQLLSYPKVSLANGVLTFVWEKKPKVELNNTTLTIN